MVDVRRLAPKTIGRVKVVLFVLALLPFVRLVVGAFTNQLGSNPLELITRSTGTWTLVFLCLTLCITPLRRLAKAPWLAQLRRMLGLFAFFYVVCHFTAFIWFDHFFDLAAVWEDVVKRPFITIGFAAFLLLLPLALTSTNGMVRRLGSVRWQALHRAVYVIAILGVVHYWWLVKRDITQPAIYAGIVALLLGLRWHHRRQTRMSGT